MCDGVSELVRGRAAQFLTRTVRVATMHRAKGLEFDRVIVVDHASGEERSAALLYVALTRARAVAVLVSVG